ncbi:amidohydrolase [uncultured Desulfovibrio sp.]|uniref:amidohydrolase n=1 Tax=uncultured Desulfovibrio sp. TaxID=167968 RepID=UPI0026335801|nr:amidohydrolase [uncultured Desulfovibrio sp.]
MNKTIIYIARSILTMNPDQPRATAVAVRDGRVLSVGGLEDIIHWLKRSPFLPYEVETLFADKILMPGLVDAHTHLASLALEYAHTFVAQAPWPRPEGGFFPVYGDKAAVLARLREADARLPDNEILWGVHYDDNQIGSPLTREELDAVSPSRPILISNMVFHRFWVNSAMLRKAGIGKDSGLPGVCYAPDGEPDGTLLEARGLARILPACPQLMRLTEEKIRHVLPLFTRQGVTTLCEAAFGAFGGYENEYAALNAAMRDAPLRVMALPFYHGQVPGAASLEDKAAYFQQLAPSAKVRFGAIKLYCDGSIISHTAPLDWPGFWDGSPNPAMQHSREEIFEALIGFHLRGMQTITHTNTNLACQIVLDAVEEAQSRCCRPDIRHRMDHCYGITPEQLRRAKALGVAVQFFTPQIWYYGDDHLALQGPDRAHALVPTGTAERLGVSWGIHCDPPGTPQLPWTAIWATMQRLTQSGIVLGPAQKVPLDAVLRAFTTEHAWQLHMEDEVGSIRLGKQADFCVLEEDPYVMPPMELRHMPVWGTVFAGEPFQAASASGA